MATRRPRIRGVVNLFGCRARPKLEVESDAPSEPSQDVKPVVVKVSGSQEHAKAAEVVPTVTRRSRLNRPIIKVRPRISAADKAEEQAPANEPPAAENPDESAETTSEVRIEGSEAAPAAPAALAVDAPMEPFTFDTVQDVVEVSSEPEVQVKARPRLTIPKPNLSEAATGAKRIPLPSESQAEEPAPPAGKEPELTPLTPVDASGSNPPDLSKSRQHRPAGREKDTRLIQARKEFRKKFQAGTPERSKMTMFDLIYYNPSTNALEGTNKPKPDQAVAGRQDDAEENTVLSERLEEEAVDAPIALDQLDNPNPEGEVVEEDEDEGGMPAPRVKVGPDGELILDEQSLVIQTTASKQAKENLVKSPLVYESGSSIANYGAYMKRKRSSDWARWDTIRFYKALNMVGTDFSMMQTVFPKRTRAELKAKFKKEERVHPTLIEEALKDVRFDPKLFVEENGEEEDEVEERGEGEEGKKKRRRKVKDEAKDYIPLLPSKKKGQTDAKPETPCGHPSDPAEAQKDASEDLAFDPNDPLSAQSSGSDNSPVVIIPGQPTRSGRMPKQKKPYSAADSDKKCPVLRAALDSPARPPAPETPMQRQSTLEQTPPSSPPSAQFHPELPAQGQSTPIPFVPNVPSPDVQEAIRTAVRNNPGLSAVRPGSVVIVTGPSPNRPNHQLFQLYVVTSAERRDTDGAEQEPVPGTSHNTTMETMPLGILPPYCVPLDPSQGPS